MRFDSRMTLSNVYPNADPPAKSVAQFIREAADDFAIGFSRHVKAIKRVEHRSAGAAEERQFFEQESLRAGASRGDCCRGPSGARPDDDHIKGAELWQFFGVRKHPQTQLTRGNAAGLYSARE